MLAATAIDLDETLLDSAGAWQRALASVAERHGHSWTAGDWAAIQGRSTAFWSGYLAGRCRGLTPEAAAAACVAAMVAAMADGRFGLLPGAAELVATAADLGPVVLVSASPAPYVRAAARTFGLAAHLRAVVTGDDVRDGKPAPEPYLLAARRVGLPPARCLAVEDSASGIRSAHAAGMTVLAIPNPATALDAEALRLAEHHAADALVAAKEVVALLSSATADRRSAPRPGR